MEESNSLYKNTQSKTNPPLKWVAKGKSQQDNHSQQPQNHKQGIIYVRKTQAQEEQKQVDLNSKQVIQANITSSPTQIKQEGIIVQQEENKQKTQQFNKSENNQKSKDGYYKNKKKFNPKKDSNSPNSRVEKQVDSKQREISIAANLADKKNKEQLFDLYIKEESHQLNTISNDNDQLKWFCRSCNTYNWWTNKKCTVCTDIRLRPYDRMKQAQHIQQKGGDQLTNLDFLFFIDFECNQDGVPEIIEFPVIVVDVKKQEIVDKFHSFVKPSTPITRFIQSLTNITDQTVKKSPNFSQVLHDATQFISKYTQTENSLNKCAVVYDCDADADYIKNECDYKKIPIPLIFLSYINLKLAFPVTISNPPRIAKSLKDMLTILEMKFEGTAHYGIDDAQNQGLVGIECLKRGYEFDQKMIESIHKNNSFIQKYTTFNIQAIIHLEFERKQQQKSPLVEDSSNDNSTQTQEENTTVSEEESKENEGHPKQDKEDLEEEAYVHRICCKISIYNKEIQQYILQDSAYFLDVDSQSGSDELLDSAMKLQHFIDQTLSALQMRFIVITNFRGFKKIMTKLLLFDNLPELTVEQQQQLQKLCFYLNNFIFFKDDILSDLHRLNKKAKNPKGEYEETSIMKYLTSSMPAENKILTELQVINLLTERCKKPLLFEQNKKISY